MSEEKKLAVLIDSDNVSAKYAQFVMNEVQKYGVPTYKRVYGDWEKGGNGWHAPAVNYSIMPVQQTSYVAGKNATDFSMIIDAMDILCARPTERRTIPSGSSPIAFVKKKMSHLLRKK